MQVAGDRCGVRHQGHTLALQGRAQVFFAQQAVDAEKYSHVTVGAASVVAKQAGWWKSALPAGCASAQ